MGCLTGLVNPQKVVHVTCLVRAALIRAFTTKHFNVIYTVLEKVMQSGDTSKDGGVKTLKILSPLKGKRKLTKTI